MKYLKNKLTRSSTHMHAKLQRRRGGYLCGLAPLRDFFILPSYRITKRLLGSLIAFFIITAPSLSSLQAQNIDREEMRQDINIMEGVLEQLFEIRRDADKIIASDSQNFITYGGNRETEGFFLANYGVIFTISEPSWTFLTTSDEKSYNFQNGEEVTKETIIDRVIQFLGDYGTTIDQLKNNDHIMVLFRGSVEAEYIKIYNAYASEFTGNAFQSLPVISIIAEMADITALSRNSLSNDEFRQRLSISTREKDEKKSTDLKIMANILETVFNEGEEEQFQISGDVNYLKLNNFGALFSFDITYGDRFDLFRLAGFSDVNLEHIKDSFRLKSFSVTKRDSSSSISITMDSLNVKWDDLAEFDSLASSVVMSLDGNDQKPEDSNRIQVYSNQKNTESEKQLAEDSKKALQQFLTKLKETIIDYGPTLDSISPNEQLIFSIDVGSAYDELPERVTLQVKKSMLEAAVRGEISEDEAMEEISVRKIQ